MSPDVRVDLLGKVKCPSCRSAKGWLGEKHIPYAEYMFNSPARRQRMYRALSIEFEREIRSVPQILVTHRVGDEWHRELISGFETEDSNCLTKCGIESLFRNR